MCGVYRTTKRQEFVIEHYREHEGLSHWYGNPTYLPATVAAAALVAQVMKSLAQYGRPFDKRRARLEALRGIQRSAVTVELLADDSFQVSEMQSHGHFMHEFTGRRWTARAEAEVDRLFRLVLRGLGERA